MCSSFVAAHLFGLLGFCAFLLVLGHGAAGPCTDDEGSKGSTGTGLQFSEQTVERRKKVARSWERESPFRLVKLVVTAYEKPHT